MQCLLPGLYAKQSVALSATDKVLVNDDDGGEEGESESTLNSQLSNISVASWSKNDIYSFGIIVAEVFGHSTSPFEQPLKNISAHTLLKKIAAEPSTVKQCIFLALKSNRIAADIMELALNCCTGDVSVRPSLVDIDTALLAMMKVRKLSDNFTEMLMVRLENYASNLATLVEQRTEALTEEESKVRRLLYQILPPTVADALKNGESVPPQTFESVSIYFRQVQKRPLLNYFRR